MHFLTLSKVKVDFAERKLIQKAYIIVEVLSTTKKIQIHSPKEFAKAALNLEQKAFVINITTLFQHPNQEVQIVVLIADKASVIILAKYSDFKNLFSKKSAMVLPKHTKINIHAINLEKSKKRLYGPIYNLEPVELKTLKTYIKTFVANSLICLLKPLANALILFNRKLDRSFQLCVDY